MLGKLSVLGRPTSLDDSRARAYCACSRCGWGLFGYFFSRLSFLFSFSAGASYNLNDSRARAYCACSRCGRGGCLDIFTLLYPFSPVSPSLWETARYRLKYCLKGPFNPKQPTNQPNLTRTTMCVVSGI